MEPHRLKRRRLAITKWAPPCRLQWAVRRTLRLVPLQASHRGQPVDEGAARLSVLAERIRMRSESGDRLLRASATEVVEFGAQQLR